MGNRKAEEVDEWGRADIVVCLPQELAKLGYERRIELIEFVHDFA